jgi:hypothetical protein
MERAAATRASRDRAAAVLAQLPPASAQAPSSGTPLEQIVAELLSTPRFANSTI